MSENSYNPVFSLYINEIFDEHVKESYSSYRYFHHFKDVKGVHTELSSLKRKPITFDYCKEEDLPKPTEEIIELQKCFLNMLTEICPLMEGEKIVKDLFTYLLAPMGMAEAHTAILIRTTTTAELIYCLHSVTIMLPSSASTEVSLKRISQTEWMNNVGCYNPDLPMNKVNTTYSLTASAKSVASQITNNLLNYMLKKITNQIGQDFLGPLGAMGIDMFFSILFPSNVNEFQQVYDMLTKIVKQELEQSDIDHINGALSNIGKALQNEYSPRRKDLNLSTQNNRQILMDLLQKYDATFLSGPGGMLGLLEQERYQKAGLGAYIAGATLRLSIYQECATIDPAKNWDVFFKPLESSYGKPNIGTVALSAKDAADFVKKVWPLVKTDRANAIHFETWQQGRVAYHDVVTVPYAKIVDDVTGEEWDSQQVDSDKHNLYIIPQKMKDHLAQLQTQAVADLVDQMGDPDNIVSKFEQLIEKPLNM